MMSRRFLILTIAALIVLLGAGELYAQSSWPTVDIKDGWRGSGFYLNWIKIALSWVLFLFWVRSTDWVSTDAQDLKLDFLRWNPILFGTFMGAFILMWFIPYFWIGFPLALIAYVAPFTTYVFHRNSKVLNNERVFTPEHIRYWLAIRLNNLGIGMAPEKLDPHERGAPVKLDARGGPDERADRANLIAARQSPGLLPARQIIAAGMEMRASAIMLDYAPTAVGVRYMIDGVWLNQEALDRETADPALEALKVLCGLNPQDRQNKQRATFAAEYESIDYLTVLACQGSQTGERVVLQFEDKKVRFENLEEIGMRSKMQEQLLELLALERGFVLFSAMPASGLRSTVDVTLRHTDRLTRDFMALEEEANRYENVENVQVTTYQAGEEGAPASVLTKMFRTVPDVVVARDLVDGDMVAQLCQEIVEDRLIVSTVRAKDGAETLLRVLALGVEPQEFAAAVTAVLGQRLIRKLCDDCKEAYAPPPQVLQQLGIPEGRIQAFYRPPEQPEEVCENCLGVGYRGRTALFELLIVGDTLRKVLGTSPKLDLLRQAGRKDGMRTLQEEGILLVAKGVTSLPELIRVLKQ